MCDPLTVAALGLTAGGTVVQQRDAAKNQTRAVNAGNAATMAEMDRQKKYQEEADTAYKPSIAQYEGSGQQKTFADALAKRSGRGDAAVDNAASYQAPTAGSAPEVVGKEVARQSKKASANAKATAGRRADLNSFGDVMFGNSLTTADAARRLGTISNKSGMSASLLPLDKQSAMANSQKTPSMLGDIMKLAGLGTGLYSFGVGGPTWGDLFGGSAGLTGANNAAFNSSFIPPNVA